MSWLKYKESQFLKASRACRLLGASFTKNTEEKNCTETRRILLIPCFLMASGSSGSCACLGFFVLNSYTFQVSQFLGLSDGTQITEKCAFVLNIKCFNKQIQNQTAKSEDYKVCFLLHPSLFHLKKNLLKSTIHILNLFHDPVISMEVNYCSRI